MMNFNDLPNAEDILSAEPREKMLRNFREVAPLLYENSKTMDAEISRLPFSGDELERAKQACQVWMNSSLYKILRELEAMDKCAGGAAVVETISRPMPAPAPTILTPAEQMRVAVLNTELMPHMPKVLELFDIINKARTRGTHPVPPELEALFDMAEGLKREVESDGYNRFGPSGGAESRN